MKLQITVDDQVTPSLHRLQAGLISPRDLNELMATAVAEEIRVHMLDMGDYRHATASRLGAKPTGHFQKIAAAVESHANDSEAYITVPSWSGLSRAFRDVTIEPTSGKKWLTIPATAAAYGRRAGDFSDLKFVPLGKDLAALMTRAKSDAKMTPVFWLKKRIFQKQDRSLLPSDELLGNVVEDAAIVWMRVMIDNGK